VVRWPLPVQRALAAFLDRALSAAASQHDAQTHAAAAALLERWRATSADPAVRLYTSVWLGPPPRAALAAPAARPVAVAYRCRTPRFVAKLPPAAIAAAATAGADEAFASGNASEHASQAGDALTEQQREALLALHQRYVPEAGAPAPTASQAVVAAFRHAPATQAADAAGGPSVALLSELRPAGLAAALELLVLDAWPEAALQQLLGDALDGATPAVPSSHAAAALLAAALGPRLRQLAAPPTRLLYTTLSAAAAAQPRACVDGVLGPLLRDLASLRTQGGRTRWPGGEGAALKHRRDAGMAAREPAAAHAVDAIARLVRDDVLPDSACTVLFRYERARCWTPACALAHDSWVPGSAFLTASARSAALDGLQSASSTVPHDAVLGVLHAVLNRSYGTS